MRGALVVAGVAAIVLVAATRKRPRSSSRSSVDHRRGVSFREGKLSIVDWGAWSAWAPGRLRELGEHTRDPGEVLVLLFGELFPEHAWPPPADSPLGSKWQGMVEVTRHAVLRDDPEGVIRLIERRR